MATVLNIVVVEDHDSLRESTVEALRGQGHHVIGLDCAEALPELNDMSIDLMIVDLNLPGENGISLAKRIRNTQPDIGIIMLTARIQLADKVAGYENGADIYLTKSTSLEELNAAVQSLARRIKSEKSKAIALQLNPKRRTLSGALDTVSLTIYESALLIALTRATEQQLESWQLIQVLGKSDQDYNKSALELLIVRLRKKLIEAGSNQKPIQAIREYGYQLCEKIQLV